jgi:hypothetical protein
VQVDIQLQVLMAMIPKMGWHTHTRRSTQACVSQRGSTGINTLHIGAHTFTAPIDRCLLGGRVWACGVSTRPTSTALVPVGGTVQQYPPPVCFIARVHYTTWTNCGGYTARCVHLWGVFGEKKHALVYTALRKHPAHTHGTKHARRACVNSGCV